MKRDTKEVNGHANRDTWKLSMHLNCLEDREDRERVQEAAQAGPERFLKFCEEFASSGMLKEEVDLNQIDWLAFADTFGWPYGHFRYSCGNCKQVLVQDSADNTLNVKCDLCADSPSYIIKERL